MKNQIMAIICAIIIGVLLITNLAQPQYTYVSTGGDAATGFIINEKTGELYFVHGTEKIKVKEVTEFTKR